MFLYNKNSHDNGLVGLVGWLVGWLVVVYGAVLIAYYKTYCVVSNKIWDSNYECTLEGYWRTQLLPVLRYSIIEALFTFLAVKIFCNTVFHNNIELWFILSLLLLALYYFMFNIFLSLHTLLLLQLHKERS
jgi:hypothetical protein